MTLFQIGKIYKRTDLHQKYGGQERGRISTPRNHKLILIFTGDSGEQYGYEGTWDDNGIFLYTGEGQLGDMTFAKGNKAIRNHLEDGKDLYLFENARKAHVRYEGQFVCTGYHYRQAPDRNNNLRQAIIFELASHKVDDIQTDTDDIKDLSLEELRHLASEGASYASTPKSRTQLYRKRSLAIKQYALKRANGTCEGCGKMAPFQNTNDAPYFEVHHIERLADSGPDHPDRVIAVCPNCHARAHYSQDAHNFNDTLRKIAIDLENKYK